MRLKLLMILIKQQRKYFKQDEWCFILNIDSIISSLILIWYRIKKSLNSKSFFNVDVQDWRQRILGALNWQKNIFILHITQFSFFLLCNDLVKSINFAFYREETDRYIWLQKCFWTSSKRDIEKKDLAYIYIYPYRGFRNQISWQS